MAKLSKDVAARKAEQAAAVSHADQQANGDSEQGNSEAAKAAINKYDDKTLDFNPAGSGYYDEYSNLNPPVSGESTTIPYHGADEEEPQQAADGGKSTVGLGAAKGPKIPSQLGFIGGAGVEGGQGNSDSIYGSHDDHSTYGVSGTGWQVRTR